MLNYGLPRRKGDDMAMSPHDIHTDTDSRPLPVQTPVAHLDLCPAGAFAPGRATLKGIGYRPLRYLLRGTALTFRIHTS